jgi:hypothetical protein
MKHYLVVRDKSKKNIEVLEFQTQADAEKEKKKRLAQGHDGELVIGFGQSMKSFLRTFTEYRPANWRKLI